VIIVAIRGIYMNVDLQLYKVFYTVAKKRSISGAAEELFISQPAVSQAIKQLEALLGSQLFIRNPRGVMLTDEGQLLYSYIEKAMDLISVAEEKFEEITDLEAGTLSIGASDTLCKHFLLPYLEKFHRLYPKINLQIANRTSRETLELLRYGKVDIGFVNLPVDIKSDIMVKKIYQVHDCFIYGEKYFPIFEGRDFVELRELQAHKVLMLENLSASRVYLNNFCKSHNVVIKPDIELGSLDLLVEFAKAGLGISAVIEEFVQKELESGVIRKLKIVPEIPARYIGLVYLKNFPISYAGKIFIKMLPELNHSVK